MEANRVRFNWVWNPNRIESMELKSKSNRAWNKKRQSRNEGRATIGWRWSVKVTKGNNGNKVESNRRGHRRSRWVGDVSGSARPSQKMSTSAENVSEPSYRIVEDKKGRRGAALVLGTPARVGRTATAGWWSTMRTSTAMSDLAPMNNSNQIKALSELGGFETWLRGSNKASTGLRDGQQCSRKVDK